MLRALIVLLAIVVLGLSVLILLDEPEPSRSGPVFPAARFVGDAVRGEEATYRDETGETLTFRVEMAVPGTPDRSPFLRIRTLWRDRTGKPYAAGAETYDHRPTRHGLFPLMAPSDPEGLDRLWVWTRIRRSSLTWQGRDRPAWRVDLVDPALPPEGGADHVVAWLDESVPAFGLLRWQRAGRTWDLVDWRPR